MSNLDQLWNRDSIFSLLNPTLRGLSRLEKLLEDEGGFKMDESASHYIMTVDTPGVKKENIKVELNGRNLLISGINHSKRTDRSFNRLITLPDTVKVEQILTEYRDGVLYVAIPKTDSTESQQVRIGQSPPGFWDKALNHQRDDGKQITNNYVT